MSEKYSAGPKLKATSARGGAERDRDRGDGSGEEGADRGGRKGTTRKALTRHLVAVEGGHDRRGLTWQVDQDGGGRAAVLRAVEDAGQHDQGRDRRQAERRRQQHGDRGGGAETGQDADGGAEEDAGEAPAEVAERGRRLEAEQEELEKMSMVPFLIRRCRSRAAARARGQTGASARRGP